MGSKFGDKLKNIRLGKKMSQEEFANYLGTSKQVISRYETNQRTPKITVAQEYADKLNIPLHYLIDDNMQENYSASKTHYQFLSLKEERNIQKKLTAIIEGLAPNNGLAFYDDEQPMTDEDKELLRISLENSLRLARQMAKQKFTPKKYREE